MQAKSDRAIAQGDHFVAGACPVCGSSGIARDGSAPTRGGSCRWKCATCDAEWTGTAERIGPAIDDFAMPAARGRSVVPRHGVAPAVTDACRSDDAVAVCVATRAHPEVRLYRLAATLPTLAAHCATTLRSLDMAVQLANQGGEALVGALARDGVEPVHVLRTLCLAHLEIQLALIARGHGLRLQLGRPEPSHPIKRALVSELAATNADTAEDWVVRVRSLASRYGLWLGTSETDQLAVLALQQH